MKKVISVLLALVMAFSHTPVTVYAADTPPVIDESTLTTTISGGKKAATIGDTVTVSVKISCSSKILYAGIELAKPDGSGNTVGLMQYNESTAKYEYTKTIESTDPAGNWRVYKIASTGFPANRSEIFNSKVTSETPKADLSAADFTVEGTGGDTTAPTIDSTSFTSDGEGNTVSPGDAVAVSVKVSDESAISSVIIDYTSPTGLDQFSLKYNSQTECYEKVIVITTEMAAGDWRVAAIEAVDEFNNKAYLANANTSSEYLSGYTADLSAGNFTVAGDTGDTTPPVIQPDSIGKTVSSGNSVAASGDTVTVFANVTDASQIIGVTAVFESPTGKTTDNKVIEMLYKSETDRFEASFTVDENTPKGEWKISSITAVDKFLNTIVLHNSNIDDSAPSADMSDADFKVVDFPQIDVYVDGKIYDKNSGTIKIEKSKPIYVCFNATIRDSYLAPVVGFSDGYEGGTLSSNGFGVKTGYASEYGYNIVNEDGYEPYGLQISADDLAVGTKGTLIYQLFETDGNFDFANFDFANAKIAAQYHLEFEVADSHKHIYNIEVTKPTCTAQGYTTHTCECGDSFVDTYVNALGHKSDKGTVTKKATYTATGVKTYKCVRCGKVLKTETIAKLPKKANTLVAKGKTATVKFANLKKKNQTVTQKNAFAISKAQGKVTYKKASGNGKITVNSAGKFTVKKGLKKGTYKIKVKVTAAGNTTYKAATKTVTVTIKVK
ncbi:MAG: hypothetical protein IJ235_01695 [Eubacterium sp.]|nr:hypothetical protein [Eubacterium sp.]